VSYRSDVLARTRSLPIALALTSAMLAGGAIAAAAPAGSAAVGSAAAGSARCPIKASSSEGAVEWAFTESGPPSGPHPGIASSYTHGRGTWAGGHASGTVCHEDSLTGGRPARELVLRIAGSARLSPGIERQGLPGVGLELKATVSASDDPACATGTHGTVTLFASYHEVHRDSVQLRFTGGCSDHDHTYTGSQLHVLIARGGAQVNSA
jgi:hypothetical protein